MSKAPSNFRRIYPNTESIIFDGGKDNKFEKALIPDNESPDCKNVIFVNGSVGTRDGAVKLNTAPAGNVAFDGLYSTRRNDGSETMIAFIGGHMFTLASTTFVTVPSAQSVFTIGNRVAAAMDENYLFVGNGSVGPYKWNGTNFTQHGVSAPVTTASVASNGAGSLTTSGQYRYKVTFVNSALVESDVGPVTSTFTVSSSGGQLTVSSIPVAPTSAGVVSRRLYRNPNSSTVFQRVTTISDNTTTTFNDNVADTALGANAPTDQGVPPKYSVILYHSSRLFMNDANNPNYVWYSEPNNPYSVPSTNFFRVGDNTSDIVRGFGVYNNYLYIFCDEAIYINFMASTSDPTTWRQIKSISPYGSKSPFSIINVGVSSENQILFPATQNKKFVGFAIASGDTLDPSSTLLTVTTSGSELQSDRIEPDMFQVQSDYLKNISGIVFHNKAYLSLTYEAGNTTNNRVYLFDYSMSNIKKSQKFSWVPFTGLNAAQFCVYGGKLYFASSTTNGFVYQIDGTGVYSDDGAAIDSYYWTKEYPGFDPDTNFTKDFRFCNLLIDNSGDYYMNLLYRVDSDSGTGNLTTISLNSSGSKWGSMVWGVDTWGGGTTQVEQKVYLGSSRGKRIQFQFSNQNTAGQAFKVHRMNFLYNIKGYR